VNSTVTTADTTADGAADVTVISSRSDPPPTNFLASVLPTIAEEGEEIDTTSSATAQLTVQQKQSRVMLESIARFATTQEGKLVTAEDILARYAPSSSATSSNCTASTSFSKAMPTSSSDSSSDVPIMNTNSTSYSPNSSSTLNNFNTADSIANIPQPILPSSSSSGSSDVMAVDTNSSSSSANNMSSSSSDNTIVSQFISGFDKLICSLSFGSDRSLVSTAPPSPTGSSAAE
jgi:hypothetical protein